MNSNFDYERPRQRKSTASQRWHICGRACRLFFTVRLTSKPVYSGWLRRRKKGLGAFSKRWWKYFIGFSKKSRHSRMLFGIFWFAHVFIAGRMLCGRTAAGNIEIPAIVGEIRAKTWDKKKLLKLSHFIEKNLFPTERHCKSFQNENFCSQETCRNHKSIDSKETFEWMHDWIRKLFIPISNF